MYSNIRISRCKMSKILTLSAKETKTNTCAKSVDPNERAHYNPFHQDIHCILFFILD